MSSSVTSSLSTLGDHALGHRERLELLTGKYEPLRRFLAIQPDDEIVSLTWAEVDGLVGPLPPSASIRQWWANTAASHQGQNWLELGRRVIEVRLGHSVVFSPVGKPIDHEQLRGATPSRQRTRTWGAQQIMDGRSLLAETLHRGGYESTVSAVAAHTLFLHPDTVAQTRGEAVFPVIRNPNARGELVEIEGRLVMYDDNTTPTLALLWAARRKKGPDVQYNHVFGDPRNPDSYTALWNLCVTPAFLAKTTDGSNHPEVLEALRYRVLDHYGFWPPGEERPVESDGYRHLTWAEMPEPVDDLEAELRTRLQQAPASPPARAARSIGWLFSEWKPDESLTAD